ncbi:hypothetical protein BDD12DRAFT_887798 [Trichophaea hybrida]|nr:hypothetical protein BDD12DRAFT_887798 [Trichophaea hybrida]
MNKQIWSPPLEEVEEFRSSKEEQEEDEQEEKTQEGDLVEAASRLPIKFERGIAVEAFFNGDVFLRCRDDDFIELRYPFGLRWSLVNEISKILRTDSQRGTEQSGIASDAVHKKMHLEASAESARTLRDRIIMQHPAIREQLSNPAQATLLPFPSLAEPLPTTRFQINDGYWGYMGREIFEELLQKVEEFERNPHASLWLYGTIGYGKSHILAALVCYLISTGDTVVYLPDCWRYAGEIMALQTMEAISGFFQNIPYSSVVFVVDQMNALVKSQPGEDDSLANQCKQGIWQWLRLCWTGHKPIFSASANFNTYFWMHRKQTHILKLFVYGGFTAKEVEKWWQKHEKDDLGDYTRQEVEELTGSIPLLLDRCMVDGKVNMSAEALVTISKHIEHFMSTI